MNSNDRKVRNIGIAVLLLMLLTSVLLKGEVVSDTSGDDDGYANYFEDMQLRSASSAESGELEEGESATVMIPEEGRVVKNMTAVLSWQDESDPPGIPRIRRYENQPDTFSLKVLSPDGNSSSDTASNPVGGSGVIEISFSMEDTVLNQRLDSGSAGTGNWTVEISLDSTGMWTPQLGPGFIALSDGGNDFSLSVEYEYYDINEEEES
ncbi:MAG: hypothetical protein R6V01_06595 [Thermoplasmatota archaeon]